jgi:heavy metal sensor kinase
MNHRSLAFRLGASYTLLLGAIFVLVGAGTFYGLQQYLRSNLADSLRRRSIQVEQILLKAPTDATSIAIAREITTRVAPEFNNRFVRVTRLPGIQIYRSGPPGDQSFDPARVGVFDQSQVTGNAAAVTETADDQHLMIRATPVKAASGNYLVELGASFASMDEGLDRLLDLLALLLPILIFCAAGGGYWLVSRALRPVDKLSQTAEQMSLQNLSLRLPVTPSGDALERLSISLNNMLSRLRDSVQASRRFVADASHELRTPLTVIKGELQELTRVSHLRQSDVRERVGSVLEEVARLEHLVSGLLVLSRLDAGETRSEWVEVDLAELARSTAEHMRLMAEDRGIDINLSGLQSAVIRGNHARLKQIIVNLLDNAIRYTAPGGGVALRTASDASGSVLEVTDTGIGIPADSIEHVFDRFYRVDEARSREDGGAGLGLSIVKSICTAHGAEVEVASLIGDGSSFRVRFPRHSIAKGASSECDSAGSPGPALQDEPKVAIEPAASPLALTPKG